MWQDSQDWLATLALWVTLGWQVAQVDLTSPEWGSWQVVQLN
jgi:hypothetical protein